MSELSSTLHGAGASRHAALYINPLPVRIWHWLNALGFVLLALTGFQIRYIDMLNIMSFEAAVKTHNWIGFIVIGNYFIWLGYYLFTDKIKVYHPELNAKKFFNNAFAQIVERITNANSVKFSISLKQTDRPELVGRAGVTLMIRE